MKMVGFFWSTLLFSKIDPAYASAFEAFSKQRALKAGLEQLRGPSLLTGAPGLLQSEE
jgi:hypothetical protein